VTGDRICEILRMTELGPEPLDLDWVNAFLEQNASVLRSICDAETWHVNCCLRVESSCQHRNAQLQVALRLSGTKSTDEERQASEDTDQLLS
jgi:hypothetical protein